MRTLLLACALATLATSAAACASSPADPDVELTDDGIADAKADAPVTGSFLTAAQAKTVLTMIDDACGDSWCEGDYNFAFRRFVCHSDTHSCTMTVQVIKADNSWLWRSCKMSRISSFNYMVDTAANGFQSLSDRFMTKVNACMDRIINSVPST